MYRKPPNSYNRGLCVFIITDRPQKGKVKYGTAAKTTL